MFGAIFYENFIAKFLLNLKGKRFEIWEFKNLMKLLSECNGNTLTHSN